MTDDIKVGDSSDVSFSVGPPALEPPVDIPLDPDLEAHVRAAMERIAEDPALTGDLTDAEARIVLEWAQGEIRRLVAEADLQNEEAGSRSLKSKFRHVRRYIRRVSRLSAAADNPAEMVRSLLTSPLSYPEEVDDSSL